MLDDIRHALRSAARRRGFALVALSTLALGIGANTAVFSVVNAVFLRPYPHLETDRWAYLWERPSAEGLTQLAVSAPNFRDWQEQARSFSDMAYWFHWSFNLSGAEAEPERVSSVVITPRVFRALG